jgi:WD40 repeat protein/serine/threonine protein kinase
MPPGLDAGCNYKVERYSRKFGGVRTGARLASGRGRRYILPDTKYICRPSSASEENRMAVPSVAALIEELRRLSLLEPEQLAELSGQLAARFAEPRALAGELVRRGRLTPYQVNQLFQGRAGQLILGTFVLLERLGEGGMGQVFKARHRKLGRIVALKVIRKERLTGSDAVRRFRREIQAAALLSHPNIVLALDADEHEGTHSFAMEYVEGDDLSKLVKRHGPLPVEQACEVIRQAALGLQHAFERGLVHRDIKPHNLLRVHQSGVVKVLDMGLARLNAHGEDESSSTTLTQEGAVMGTPDYIAPEQAMDSRSADIRADLYSLGCTFYFLLTGRVPFPGGTVMEKLFRHQTETPPPVRALRPDMPPLFAAVVDRLMAKRPADRFQTPAELVVALAAAQSPAARVAVPAAAATVAETEPLNSPKAKSPDISDTFADLRPDTVHHQNDPRQARRAAERKRLLILCGAGAGALIVLILLLVLVFKGGSRDRPATDGPSADFVEEKDAEAADKEWKELHARLESPGGDRARLREEVVALRRTHPGSRAARDAAGCLARLPSPLDGLTVAPLEPLQKLPGQPKELLAILGDHRSWMLGSGATYVADVQYSRDGRWLACNTGEGTIRLLDPGSLEVRAVLKAEQGLSYYDFRSDGKALAACGLDIVTLWDLGTNTPRLDRVLKDFPGRVGLPAYSHDGKLLAVPCSKNGEKPTVQLWDLSAGEPREKAVLSGHEDHIYRPAFSPDGKTLATSAQDKIIRVWDLSSAEPTERAVLKGHGYWVGCVAFSPDGKLLTSCGIHDRTIRLWDMTVPTPKELSIAGVDGAPERVAFSPDGKLLAGAFWQGNWQLWDVSERQFRQLSRIPDHAESSIVFALTFAPDGRTLATGANDGTVHLWDITQQPPVQRRFGPGHVQPITGLAFAPDDRTLVSMSADRSVRLWDLKTPTPVERAVLPVQAGVVCGAIRPDGRTLVTGDSSNKLMFWSFVSGKGQRSAPGHDSAVVAAAYSPDGKTLVTAGADNTLKFWDVETGDMRRVERLEQPIRALAFNPDGRGVAVALAKDVIQVWHSRTSVLRAACRLSGENGTGLIFSPEGKLLASGGKDGSVHFLGRLHGTRETHLPRPREVGVFRRLHAGRQAARLRLIRRPRHRSRQRDG